MKKTRKNKTIRNKANVTSIATPLLHSMDILLNSTLHHITSHHAIPHPTTTTSHHTTPHHTTPHYTTPHHTAPQPPQLGFSGVHDTGQPVPGGLKAGFNVRVQLSHFQRPQRPGIRHASRGKEVRHLREWVGR